MNHKSEKPVVVSGIRSTGHLHLGNLLGAIQHTVKMQEDYQCYFFIADIHSLTTHPSPQDLHQQVKNVLVEWIAAGINPEKAVLYIQSDIPEISELYTLLNMHAYLGELERCTSFKDKVRKHPDNVNAGLLTYPVLMASDILIHRATYVPVGKDQEQHLEMTRKFAKRFNRTYDTEIFPEPEAFSLSGQLIKVPGLDGSGKMGKSEGKDNAVFLAEEPASIKKKIMRAVTDTGPLKENQPVSESVQNLFTLMSYVSKPDTLAHFKDAYSNCTIRYGDLKKQLAEDMVNFLSPYREKIIELSSDNQYLSKIAAEGAEKARASASETLKDVKHAIGFRSLF